MQCPTDGTTLADERAQRDRDRLLPHLPGRVARPGRARQDHRALPHPAGPPAPRPQPPPQQYQQGYQRDYRPSGDHQQGYRKPKKKESWLSELFD